MNIDWLYNILLSDKPSILIKKNEDKVFELIPELKKCKGFNQNNIWHIYDVYNHILCVIDNTKNDLVLRLTALFHDIGKPDSYVEDKNKVGHFPMHYELSKKIFDEFSRKYNIDNDISKLISNLIYYHDVRIDKLSENEICNLCKIFSYDEIKMLYEIKKADLLAQNTIFHHLLDNYLDEEKMILSKYNKYIKR